MKPPQPYLGLDLGASSGRAVLGFLSGERLTIREINRFANAGVQLGGTLYWDVLSLWANVLNSIRTCAQEGYVKLSGIAVDTWGVDFGLLGPDGKLLGNPVHYRDARTEGIEQEIARHIDEERLYRLTGLPLTRVSSFAQLVAMKRTSGAGVLDRAQAFLLMADLFRYFLSGHVACELTAAGGTQLANVNTQAWCTELFEAFGLPLRIAPELIKPGHVVGALLPEVSSQTGLASAPVVAPAGHDTSSAAAAIPLVEPDSAFLSCGTWSVLGIVTDSPILSADALRLGFSNEFGLDSILFVRNMMGLYLLEELRRAWTMEGKAPSYAAMLGEASQAKPFKAFVNVNDPPFFAGRDPESAVASYLRRTKQKPLGSHPQITRTVLEGLAFSCREVLGDLERLIERRVSTLVVVGGGVRNRLLCQMIADATGLKVVTGPAEATVIGNLAIQALATGQIGGPCQIREVVAKSFKLRKYEPRHAADWDKSFRTYQDIAEQARSTEARS